MGPLRPHPADKSLCDPLAGSPSAEELGEGRGGRAIRRDRREEDEHGEALAEVDVLRLLEEADVPAHGSPFVLVRVSICEQERQLERLRQATNWSSEAAESASVMFPRSRARRKRM